MKNLRYTATCPICLTEFKANHPNAKYCSAPCRKEAYPRLERPEGLPPLPGNTVSEIAHLRVAADLLRLGLHVYRSVSIAAPCDLAVLSAHGKLLRVEVRTGYQVTDTERYVTNRHCSHKECDIFAIVLPDRIVYEPMPDIPIDPDFTFLCQLADHLKPTSTN
jgi:hypothetical protein